MKMNSKIQDFVKNLPTDYLVQIFKDDSNRCEKLTKSTKGIRIDFSKQLWNEEIVHELTNFLDQDQTITNRIKALFDGEKINTSEGRAVKHYLLRAPVAGYPDPDLPKVIEIRESFLDFAEKIFKDHSIENLINIGIGGSDLGPLMVHQALGESKKKVFYVSNVDPADLASAINQVDLAKTLFVIVSKTFTTKETMMNAEKAREAVVAQLGEDRVAEHFVAVSTNLSACVAFGIDQKRIFGFWDWVGGRYSLASAVGISIACAYGRDTFENLLKGMHEVDLHFRDTPLIENLAFWHALSWIFNINYLGAKANAVIPYSFRMKYFTSFLQQLIMESNGKSVDIKNKKLDHSSSSVVFGERGTNSQHSFFQMLHQGTNVVPVDFIVFKPDSKDKSEIALVANALAQAAVFAFGGQAPGELSNEKIMPGNRPSNLILVEKFDAYQLGALISLYEASTIIQGFIWGLNSFDQWGVQLGKVVADEIERSFTKENTNLDSSTKRAIEFLN
jgi:glucose-6-phosphate isomerase